MHDLGRCLPGWISTTQIPLNISHTAGCIGARWSAADRDLSVRRVELFRSKSIHLLHLEDSRRRQFWESSTHTLGIADT